MPRLDRDVPLVEMLTSWRETACVQEPSSSARVWCEHSFWSADHALAGCDDAAAHGKSQSPLVAINDLTKAAHFAFREILDSRIRANTCAAQDLETAASTYPIEIG